MMVLVEVKQVSCTVAMAVTGCRIVRGGGCVIVVTIADIQRVNALCVYIVSRFWVFESLWATHDRADVHFLVPLL